MSMIQRWVGWLHNRMGRRDQTGAATQDAPGPERSGNLAASLMRGIANTLPDEIGCDECFDALDQFVELTLAGESAADRLPDIHAHLQRCPDCREEYEALSAALQATA